MLKCLYSYKDMYEDIIHACACTYDSQRFLQCGDAILGMQAAIYGDSNLRSQFRKIPRHPETCHET